MIKNSTLHIPPAENVTRRVYWSERFQTLVYEGVYDPVAETVEIFEALTNRYMGSPTTREWDGD